MTSSLYDLVFPKKCVQDVDLLMLNIASLRRIAKTGQIFGSILLANEGNVIGIGDTSHPSMGHGYNYPQRSLKALQITITICLDLDPLTPQSSSTSSRFDNSSTKLPILPYAQRVVSHRLLLQIP